MEQQPATTDGKPTTRFKKVTHFLEEAVKVVPLESIFHAIAFCTHGIAEKCLETMMQKTPRLVPSEMMTSALWSAYQRVRGFPPPQLRLEFNMVTLSHHQAQAMHKRKSRVSYSDAAKNLSHGSGAQEIVLPPVFFDQWSTSMPHFSEKAIEYLDSSLRKVYESLHYGPRELDVGKSTSIDNVYLVHPNDKHKYALKSPIETLKDTKKKLKEYIESAEDEAELFQDTSTELKNEQMLKVLKEIFHNDVTICTALLGAFMERQIQIPLLYSPEDTVKVLSSKVAPVTLGVWALFSLNREDLKHLLESSKHNALKVEIKEYLKGVCVFSEPPQSTNDQMYAGKLQFLLSGMANTVSCSTRYVSYSLEYQLCENPKVEKVKGMQLQTLIAQWDKIFANDALSLVASSHRPLVARWLKWAILIHDLREVLAQYTCIGVTGLVNSGKSQLVKKLFEIEVSTEIPSSSTLQCYNTICITIIMLCTCIHSIWDVVSLVV